MTERMRRLLDQTFGGFGLEWAQSRGWTPAVDLEEAEDAYIVEAELPGVKREDVEVELLGNELSIAGECKERERKGAVRRQGRRTGRFEYRLSLPHDVKGDNVEASLSEGVLTVRVPKAERAQRRTIEVK
ncbi:MAG TPA: Hsp20/alpha crystallin family protein [Gaiellaceae bacterium]|jgi:HSP20 family protein